MTQTMTEEQTSVVTDDRPDTSNDKPESAHYVLSPSPDEGHHAYVMRARFEGFAVTALCGYTWVPNKMATNLPHCQECIDIFDSMPDDGGGFPRE